MPVNAANIPVALKGYDRWVCWSWIWDETSKRFNKPPLNARNGYHAKSTDPATWVSFDDALAAHRSGRFDGIGFTFGSTGNSGIIFSGMDLDKCVTDGNIGADAVYLASRLNSYTEFSPSGNGIKVFTTGAILGPGKKKDDALRIEMYDSGRYFTVTGNHVPWSPTEIFDRTDQFKDLREEIYHQRSPSYPRLTDAEIALSALSGLNKSRADGYDSWLCVGMALKNIGDDLLSAWDQWSMNCSEKYAEGVCAKKWVTFRRSGLGIGSLIHWAKEDGWNFLTALNGRQATNGQSTNGYHSPQEQEIDYQAKIKEKEMELADLKRQDQEKKKQEKEHVKEEKKINEKNHLEELKVTFSKFGLDFRGTEWFPGEWKLSVINSEPITYRLRTPFLAENGIVLTVDQFDSAPGIHKAVLEVTGKICLQDKPRSWELIWNGYKNYRGVKAKLLDDADDEEAPAEIKRSYVVAQWLYRRLQHGRQVANKDAIDGHSHLYLFEDGSVAVEFMHVWKESSESADKIKRPEMSFLLNETLKAKKISKGRRQYLIVDVHALTKLESILGVQQKPS